MDGSDFSEYSPTPEERLDGYVHEFKPVTWNWVFELGVMSFIGGVPIKNNMKMLETAFLDFPLVLVFGGSACCAPMFIWGRPFCSLVILPSDI